MRKFAFLLVALAFLTATAQAQTESKAQKIGFTSVEYIFSLSPRSREIESEIKSRTQILQKEIENKQRDLQAKYEAYERNKASMMESIRADKEQEIRNLNEQLQKFQSNADTELKAKYEELITPETDKIAAAIKSVADENGYDFVLTGNPQVMLFGAEKFDVTDLVLKKLGIDPVKAKADAEKAASTPATTPSNTPAPAAKPKPGAVKPVKK